MSVDDQRVQPAVVRILIIDDEQQAVDRIAGLLLAVRAPWPAIVCRSVADARRAVLLDVPDIIILDPEVGNVDEMTSFVRETNTAHPDIQWIINTHERWWRRYGHRFIAGTPGGFIHSCRRLNKGVTYFRAQEQVAAVLGQCENELALRMLVRSEVASGVADDRARADSVLGFLSTHLTPLLATLGSTGNEGERRPAFVSTQFNREGRERFDIVLRPLLEELGYWPVIMFAQSKYNTQSMPASVFYQIERAKLYVADLTGPSPDVLVEVGAAWIAGIPMVLVVSSTTPLTALPVVVRTQQINVYDSYPDLREKLRTAIDQA